MRLTAPTLTLAICSLLPAQVQSTLLPQGDIGFGVAMAMQENWLVVGTRSESAYAYTLEAGEWTLIKRMTAADASPDAGFGTAVAVDGEAILIGAPRDDFFGPDSGSAFQFVALRPRAYNPNPYVSDGTRILAAAVIAGDRFGTAVAVSNGFRIVGAPGRVGDDENSGTATLLELLRVPGSFISKEETTHFGARPSAAVTNFGSSIAFDEDRIAIGAIGDAATPGSVQIFEMQDGRWRHGTLLTSQTPQDDDGFGSVLAIEGDRILVANRPIAGNSNYVHVFLKAGVAWIEETKLKPLDVVPSDEFGSSVAISNDRILIGAPGKGVAYLYELRSGAWTEAATLAGGSPSFGGSVAMYGDDFAVSSGDIAEAGEVETYAPALPYGDGCPGILTEFPEEQLEIASLRARSQVMKVDAVVLDHDTMAVSAAAYDEAQPYQKVGPGIVYVMVRDGNAWIEQAQIRDPDRDSARGGVGTAIALQGDLLAVNGINTYLFERNGSDWKRVATFSGETTSFGNALLIQNEQLFIAERWANGARGQVHVYEKIAGTWLRSQTLEADDGRSNDAYGTSMASDGETLVIGRSGRGLPVGPFSLDIGGAYIYRQHSGDWQLEQKIESQNQQFGASVAVDGNLLVVGAPTVYQGDGFAHIYRRHGKTWSREASVRSWAWGKLFSTFGAHVAIDSGRIAISVDAERWKGTEVYEARGDGWEEIYAFLPRHRIYGDLTGNSLAMDGNTILAGTKADETESPTAFMFELPPTQPVLRHSSGLPMLGRSMDLNVLNVFPGTAAIGILGLSKTSWNGQTLPFDLGFLGHSDCSLLVSPDRMTPLGRTGNTANWQFDIPDDTSLLGTSVFLQALSVDMSSPTPVSLSNAIESRVGG